MTNLMIIDDDPQIRKLMHRWLEKAGYQVTTAENGHKGLRCLEEAPCQIVITDIVMPDMEGLETIQHLRQTQPGVKILAISGGGNIEADVYLNLASILGADGVLSKPFEKDTLLEAVANLK